jgi:hypothetical protein
MEGIEQPGQINTDALRKLKSRKGPAHSTEELVDGIFSGNRTLLSKAITLVESSLPKHQEQAQEIISACLLNQILQTPNPNSQIRIPKSEFPNPNSQIRIPKSEFPNPNSQIRIPKSESPNPNPQIRIPKSEFPNLNSQIRIPNSKIQASGSV